MRTDIMEVDGMYSHQCIDLLKRFLSVLYGVRKVKVEFGSVVVEYDEIITSRKELVEAVERLGYKVRRYHSRV